MLNNHSYRESISMKMVDYGLTCLEISIQRIDSIETEGVEANLIGL